MTKREAARKLREYAFVIRLSLDGDEGADEWASGLEEIAAQLDPETEKVSA